MSHNQHKPKMIMKKYEVPSVRSLQFRANKIFALSTHDAEVDAGDAYSGRKTTPSMWERDDWGKTSFMKSDEE